MCHIECFTPLPAVRADVSAEQPSRQLPLYVFTVTSGPCPNIIVVALGSLLLHAGPGLEKLADCHGLGTLKCQSADCTEASHLHIDSVHIFVPHLVQGCYNLTQMWETKTFGAFQ